MLGVSVCLIVIGACLVTDGKISPAGMILFIILGILLCMTIIIYFFKIMPSYYFYLGLCSSFNNGEIHRKFFEKIPDLFPGIGGSFERLDSLLKEQDTLKLSTRQAEFLALQNQINPHFLYNTLGAINTYAIEADQKEIEQMVSALSKMLRYAVQNPLEPVKIADEAEHVENYLTIMRYRHGRMPRIIWDVKSCLSEPILRLTVQPLIENVFQHAFEDGISEEHFIRIRARREKDVLLEVEDNGIGIEGLEGERQYRLEEVTNITFGIGMSNVNKRIQLIYGEEYGITVFRNQSGGTTVRLVLPEAGSDGRFAGIGM